MSATETIFGIALFTGLLTLLALLVQLARARLVPSGPARVTLNEGRTVVVASGTDLLRALSEADVMLPAACGGGGTCGLCRVRVLEGGGVISPIERSHVGRREAAAGVRLACQVKVRDGLRVRVPDEAFGVREWTCKVARARSLTPLVRELVLALPEGERMEFRSGAFVQVSSRPYRLALGDLPAAQDFPDTWRRMGLTELEAGSDVPVTRAYSLANRPADVGVACLDVRLALPPPSAPEAPPGVVSTWLFSLKEGDPVSVQGPHGHFFVEDDDSELVFIGGGVGMAPLRAHVFDQLEGRHATRRMSFWYGARSREDLFYTEELDGLAAAHENFSWHVALSEPAPGDAWDGPTGFIHRVVLDQYLASHPAPEDCRYYLCGPPMMIRATVDMLDGLGVEPDRIVFDDFGT